MYICMEKGCHFVFQEPANSYADSITIDGKTYRYFQMACPECGGTYIEEAVGCDICGEYVPEFESVKAGLFHVCNKCRQATHKTLVSFIQSEIFGEPERELLLDDIEGRIEI